VIPFASLIKTSLLFEVHFHKIFYLLLNVHINEYSHQNDVSKRGLEIVVKMCKELSEPYLTYIYKYYIMFEVHTTDIIKIMKQQ